MKYTYSIYEYNEKTEFTFNGIERLIKEIDKDNEIHFLNKSFKKSSNKNSKWPFPIDRWRDPELEASKKSPNCIFQ